RGSEGPRCSGSRGGTGHRPESASPSRAARSSRAGEARSSGGSRASRSYAGQPNSGLGLLEQRLPPLEQRLQLVAGSSMGREQVDVAPVVREPALEIGDRLLLARDLRLDPLQLAGPRASTRASTRYCVRGVTCAPPAA